MNALNIIDKYYPEENELKRILLTHSRSVADKALWIADKHPELNLDKAFLEEAAYVIKSNKTASAKKRIKFLANTKNICLDRIGKYSLPPKKSKSVKTTERNRDSNSALSRISSNRY